MTLVLQDTLVLSPATAKKLEQEIEDIKGATDCADVVGTYAELEAYDTSKLTDQAIVKVLQDETQNDAQTYYRWSTETETFTLLGELGPYYTKQEADELYATKQNKPSAATQNNIATFDNAKNTVDSGKAFTTSVAATSSAVDTKIPTEKAVRTELDTKVNANSAITGATKTKITYDSKGLVTAGADLVESDIPSLHLTKVSDVSATAAEVNKLAGLETTKTELGYVHGVTSAVQTQINSKQPTLVSGTNIKTINGNNILGSGNLELTQFLGFPSDWPTTSSTTTKAFCDVVAADADAIEGKMYLGEVRWSDLSTVGLVNAEVAVKIMKGTTAASKVIVLTMSSGNHAPYQWQYTYWNGGASTSGWIGFQPELPSQSGQSGKFLTTNGSSMSWGTVDLSTKVDKTNSASKVYGTDVNGAQTTYNVDSFGQVDDVKINNTSIVNNKIANITIDNALNTSSTNAVQNGVVATAINNKSGVVFKTWSD